MLKKVACLAFAGAVLASNGASAAVVTSNLGVTATIDGTCTLTTATAINFGTNSATVTQIDIAPVAVVVNCSTGVPYTVGMNDGSQPNGSQRRMFNNAGAPVSTDYLIYDLFTDATRTQRILTSGAGLLSGTGNGANQNVSIFPSILSQTTPSVSTFNDTVLVTLNY